MIKPATDKIPYLAQRSISILSSFITSRDMLYYLRVDKGPAENMMIEQVIKMLDKEIDKYIEQLKDHAPAIAQLLID